MQAYQVLQEVYDTLTYFQQRHPLPNEPVDRVIKAIEMELGYLLVKYEPTLYESTKCEICGKLSRCFSVLCTQKHHGSYLTGNNMVCMRCLLIKGERV
jgi:hypothetical protein